MEGFRRQPGITLYAGGEHVDELVDHNGIADGVHTVSLRDSGYVSTGLDHGNSYARFRCVAPLTNR